MLNAVRGRKRTRSYHASMKPKRQPDVSYRETVRVRGQDRVLEALIRIVNVIISLHFVSAIYFLLNNYHFVWQSQVWSHYVCHKSGI